MFERLAVSAEFNNDGSHVLFSTGTHLAYTIAKNYYHNIHYVWCSELFHSNIQPPTSDPCAICRRWIEIVSTGDRHAIEIDRNIAGILNGANSMRCKGLISKSDFESICKMISGATYEAFLPVVYVICAESVKEKVKRVSIDERASNTSSELKIETLCRSEFQLISLSTVINGIIPVSDEFVGHYEGNAKYQW